jgi:predicted O-methyltransferase YrrM
VTVQTDQPDVQADVATTVVDADDVRGNVGERLAATLTELHGGDPFADVAAAAAPHRDEHGDPCGLFPADPGVLGLAATCIALTSPVRVLDLGCGFGYSTLWIASRSSDTTLIDGVDRFPEHVARARGFVDDAGLGARIEVHTAEAHAFLSYTDTLYDAIHDDAWFAQKPDHLAAMLARLRPGGLLTMPNWFLLTDALSDEPSRDWTPFAGPTWREDTLAYARHLATHDGLDVRWITTPPLAIAVRR